MFHFRHRTLIIFSGVVWLAVGLWLFTLGLRLIAGGIYDVNAHLPLLSKIVPYSGSLEYGAIALIAAALIIGYFKGNKILGKSARRIIARLSTFQEPMHIKNVYAPSYYVLLGSMIFLGMAIKIFQVPIDIRGFVDTTIGAALIYGSTHYFKSNIKK